MRSRNSGVLIYDKFIIFHWSHGILISSQTINHSTHPTNPTSAISLRSRLMDLATPLCPTYWLSGHPPRPPRATITFSPTSFRSPGNMVGQTQYSWLILARSTGLTSQQNIHMSWLTWSLKIFSEYPITRIRRWEMSARYALHSVRTRIILMTCDQKQDHDHSRKAAGTVHLGRMQTMKKATQFRQQGQHGRTRFKFADSEKACGRPPCSGIIAIYGNTLNLA